MLTYFSLSQELAQLIRSSRPFMLTIAKAKTAKLSKKAEDKKRIYNVLTSSLSSSYIG